MIGLSHEIIVGDIDLSFHGQRADRLQLPLKLRRRLDPKTLSIQSTHITEPAAARASPGSLHRHQTLLLTSQRTIQRGRRLSQIDRTALHIARAGLSLLEVFQKSTERLLPFPKQESIGKACAFIRAHRGVYSA